MKKTIIMLPAFIGLLFVVNLSACNKEALLKDYDGNQLEQAINKTDLSLLVFIPQLKEAVEAHVKTPEQLRSIQAFAADMINKAKTADPEFYANFISKINSKDPEMQTAALNAGLDKVGEQLKNYCGDQQLTQDQIFYKIFSDY